MMQAQHCEDGTLAVSGATRKEYFNRIWAGIGWPERDPGHICVLGERTDGLYHALWEKQGGLWELGRAALEAKDRFLIDCMWVDARDAISTSYLRTLEGLCFYDDPKRAAAVGIPAGSIPSGRRNFKGSNFVAIVAPVSDRIATNYRAALEKIRGILMQGKVVVYETNCPRLIYTLRQPLEDLLKSPVMKAFVWVLTALESAAGNGALDLPSFDPWYGNFSREMD